MGEEGRKEKISSLKWKVLFFLKLESIQMKEKDHSNARTWMQETQVKCMQVGDLA